MKTIEENDRILFRKAQQVIRDCERQRRYEQQQQQHRNVVGFVEGMYQPLKSLVGEKYWNDARMMLHQQFRISKSRSSDNNGETITKRSNNNTSILTAGGETSATSNANHHHHGGNGGNNNKKKLWCTIKIFMKYLEQDEEDRRLFVRAKTLVQECVEQHRFNKYDEHCASLGESIKSCLLDTGEIKNAKEYWNKADRFVEQAMMLRNRNRKTTTATTTTSTTRKQQHEGSKRKIGDVCGDDDYDNKRAFKATKRQPSFHNENNTIVI
jgi:hypothetical protein